MIEKTKKVDKTEKIDYKNHTILIEHYWGEYDVIVGEGENKYENSHYNKEYVIELAKHWIDCQEERKINE